MTLINAKSVRHHIAKGASLNGIRAIKRHAPLAKKKMASLAATKWFEILYLSLNSNAKMQRRAVKISFLTIK